MSTFAGFPASGLQFMRDLADNNNKAWFEAHKQTYTDSVQTPAIALVQTLGERLRARFPDVRYDTRTNGSGSLMRLHRDVRFSTDKSPYKTHIAMMFPASAGKKMEAPGFGLQITPTQVDLMAGQFGFLKDALSAYREAVLNARQGQLLEDAIARVRAAGDYTLNGQEYKRVPQGYDAGHPRAEYLKFTGLWFSAPSLPLAAAQTPQLVDHLMSHFEAMSPIVAWLTHAVTGVE
jgi:uncharacterized protein (TIGR02453 family)